MIPLNPFQFSAPAQILFGEGCRHGIAKELVRLGTRVFVCTGRNVTRADELITSLHAEKLVTIVHAVTAEPDIDSINIALTKARDFAPHMVLGCGGGSVLDTAKALAAFIPNSRPPLDYLEIVGRGLPLENPALPCITIPTSAGTGAEATRNAVIGVPEKRVKVSLRHTSMMPRFAVVDPELTWSLPPAATAYGGMDALTQLIEAWICNAPTPFTDALCRDGIPRAARSLKAAWVSAKNGIVNKTARADMALVALESGMALANAKLGAVHGVAGPLGGMIGAPHGALCARLVVEVVETNWKLSKTMQASARAEDLSSRFAELACMVMGNPDADPADTISYLRALSQDLEIPSLKHWGLSFAEIPGLVQASLAANSMKGNPFALEGDAVAGIIERCWH